jgi:hypothetical protein
VRQSQSVIERNERICRKLVWLPPADCEDYEASLNAFMKRTFLAFPWLPQNFSESAVLAGPRGLDSWALLARTIAEVATAQGERFSEDEAQQWIEALSQAQGGDRADRLVEALGGVA